MTLNLKLINLSKKLRKMSGCYGLVLKWNDKIILCRKNNGWISFPKGKFEKRKDSSGMECAKREFLEEACITNFTFRYNPNVEIEYNENGNVSCRYYLGIIDDPNQQFTSILRESGEEITSSKWKNSIQISMLDSKMFIERRKQIAYKCLTMHSDEFTKIEKI